MRVWTAVARNRLRFSAFEVGNGSSETLRSLWGKIKKNDVGIVCTDGKPSYSEVLCEDNDIKHVMTKSETCLVESYNSVLSYYLARLHLKTKCYSKSIKMLRTSVNMLIHKNLLISL
ncbi:MAG: hypothetical protein LBB21_06795 [Holosporaceae bacterium]|nr:hypothetical protein [Holosporaceae bacterium]